MHDDGLLVYPRFLDGPLLNLSGRALKVYLVVRAKAVRRPQEHTVEGVTVLLQPGEAVLSTRLLRDIVGGGINQTTDALAELERHGLIARVPVERKASSNQRRKRLQNEDASHADKRLQIRDAGRVVASRIKLLTVNALPDVKRLQIGDDINTRAKRATSSPLSEKDRAEYQRVDQLLAAEGR